MNNYKLFDFQEKAVNNLISSLLHSFNLKKKYFKNKKNLNILLKAPTGSGKTIILAKFIKKFFEQIDFFQYDQKFAFIWFSPAKGGLPLQSLNRIQSILNSKYEVYTIDEMVRGGYSILENTVTVFSWSKGDKKKNRLNSETERQNLPLFLKNSEGVNVITIVDEEHYAKTEKTLNIIEKFKPYCQIRTSATPIEKHINDFDNFINVYRKDVIEAELIKKSFVQNDDIDDSIEFETSEPLAENSFLIKAALKKQKELKALFVKENSNVNPLIIIQLPDVKKDNDFYKVMYKEAVTFLNKEGLSFEKNNLAVHLDKEKKNHYAKTLKPNNSQVVCLITKQAIAHGWDCPRAQILVSLRSPNGSKIFKTQSIGRVCRMPELKHYEEEKLNWGYLYSFHDLSSYIDPEKNKDKKESEFNVNKTFDLKLKKEFKHELKTRLKNQKQNYLRKGSKNNFEYASLFKNWYLSKTNLSPNSKDIEKQLNEDFKSLNNSELNINLSKFHFSGDNLEVVHSEEKTHKLNYKEDAILFLEKKFHAFCSTLSKRLKQKGFKDVREILEFLFSYNSEWYDQKLNHEDVLLYDFNIWKKDNQNKVKNFYVFFLNNFEKWLSFFTNFEKDFNNQEVKNIQFDLIQKEIENFQFFSNMPVNFKVEENGKKKFLAEPSKCLYKNFVDINTQNFSGPEKAFLNFLERGSSTNLFEWWFRNIENWKYSWKIIYLDDERRKHLFFPDFILKFDNKYHIIEIKDASNQDTNLKNKFNYLKLFCKKWDLGFAFVIYKKNGELLFNNTIWDPNYNSENWKPLEALFLKKKEVEETYYETN